MKASFSFWYYWTTYVCCFICICVLIYVIQNIVLNCSKISRTKDHDISRDVLIASNPIIRRESFAHGRTQCCNTYMHVENGLYNTVSRTHDLQTLDKHYYIIISYTFEYSRNITMYVIYRTYKTIRSFGCRPTADYAYINVRGGSSNPFLRVYVCVCVRIIISYIESPAGTVLVRRRQVMRPRRPVRQRARDDGFCTLVFSRYEPQHRVRRNLISTTRDCITREIRFFFFFVSTFSFTCEIPACGPEIPVDGGWLQSRFAVYTSVK